MALNVQNEAYPPITAERALLEIALNIMLKCEMCPDEHNCHPPGDMWRLEDGSLICEDCSFAAEIPNEDLRCAPRLIDVVRALLAEARAVERERCAAAGRQALLDLDLGNAGVAEHVAAAILALPEPQETGHDN